MGMAAAASDGGGKKKEFFPKGASTIPDLTQRREGAEAQRLTFPCVLAALHLCVGFFMRIMYCSEAGGTQLGFPMFRYPNFCFLPAPVAHSVGHVLISQFPLFLRMPRPHYLYDPIFLPSSETQSGPLALNSTCSRLFPLAGRGGGRRGARSQIHPIPIKVSQG